jgi:hypothetical protein
MSFSDGVAAGGAVVGEQREADGLGGAFGDGLRAAVTVEVGGGGIDLDG